MSHLLTHRFHRYVPATLLATIALSLLWQLLLISVAHAQNYNYSFFNLDDPNGINATYPVAINGSGIVVGQYGDANGAHCFVYNSATGNFTNFNNPNGVYVTDPQAINGSGIVTGYYLDANNAHRGFVYNSVSGKFTNFDDPNAGVKYEYPQGTYPLAINDSGIVTGYVVDTSNAIHGFLYNSVTGNLTNFDDPNAGTGVYWGTRPFAINNNGIVTGYYNGADGGNHGFVYSSVTGKFITLDDPNAATKHKYPEGTYPVAINGNGIVLGDYYDANGVEYGFLYNSVTGNLTNFSDPNAGTGVYQGTAPYAINDSGIVTGYYEDANGGSHGFLYNSVTGKFTTLDDPNVRTGPYPDTDLSAINDSGIVIGNYVDANNVVHGFIAIPILVPTISRFSPTVGPVGTSVTISGSHFIGATAVKFNTTTATIFKAVSDTSITATVPAGASTGKISVTTQGGTTNSSSQFTITATNATSQVAIQQGGFTYQRSNHQYSLPLPYRIREKPLSVILSPSFLTI